jgi:signal transduction histidine kinase
MMIEVAMRVQSSLADDRTRIFLEVDHDTPRLVADRRQLEHAIEELASNALEAMPQGGYLHMEAAAADADTDRRCVVLRVSDTGPGIPAELRTRVLEPGFSTRAGRSGLGLAWVRDTVYAHGGEVRVGADPTGGAEIRLILPAA